MKKIELTEGQKKHANITRVKKAFQYEDLHIIIAEVAFDINILGKQEKYYTNSVIAPNGGSIPIGIIQKRETLKSIQERTINALNDFKKRGADVKNELTRTLSL